MQLPAVQTKFLDLPNSFSLRNGATLDKVRVAYEQYGTLTPNKDNAILLFHALSGSQHAYGYNPEVPGIDSLWKPETTRAGGTASSAPASRWTQTASASSAPITWEAATAPQAPLPPALRTASPTAPVSRMWRPQTRHVSRPFCWTAWA